MRIVLLSDGTGNAAASVWRTNVWRIFESLERVAHSQVVQYEDGVGTSSFLPDSLFGLMFGKGLEAKVLHFYEFLCRTYSDGDEIFAFGFSRGAYTMHTVIGMVADQGLVNFTSEAELHRRAKAAYRAYRQGRSGNSRLGLISRFRTRRSVYDPSTNRRIANIRFVGLWDTVAAYGLPIEEMARGISRWFSGLRLPDRRLSKCVQRACHALSLDDERTTFHPMLWDESEETAAQPDQTGARHTKDERISQVWFSGVHANVGGGYPDDSLAHVSLCWIMQEAALCGLTFKRSPESEPDAVKTKHSMMDDNGRLYDSRTGLFRFYRYGPRKVFDLCHTQLSQRLEDRVEIAVPKIHCSVFERIRSGTDQYCPIGVPERYEIVNRDGTIVPSSKYETPDQARARSQYQERAWDLVFKRKIINFSMVAIIACLIFYPFLRDLHAVDEFVSPVRWVSDLVRLFGAFLPAFLAPWVNGYARSPVVFVLLLLILALLNKAAASSKARIQDELRAAWAIRGGIAQNQLPNGIVFRFRTSPLFQAAKRETRLRLAPFTYAVLAGFLFLYLTTATVNRVLFLVMDSAGIYCEDTPSRQLPKGQSVELQVSIDRFCTPSGIQVESGDRYVVGFTPVDPWSDGGRPVRPLAMRLTDYPFWLRIPVLFLEPFKRSYGEPWFTMILRIGSVGGDEVADIPSEAELNQYPYQFSIRARRSGQLFFYANDIALSAPFYSDLFYRDNSGRLSVTIARR